MKHKYYYAVLVILILMLSTCSGKSVTLPPNILTANTESQIRTILGIPSGAAKVMIVSQSSHWDIDWTDTFDGYYKNGVESIINKALNMLDEYKDYYYSISDIAFLKKYWNDHPEDHARIVKYLKDGRLRIVGGGMTSPDTNLPTGEALTMDWFYGNLWVYNISGVKPITAWQPDSFGHTPSLPDILYSLGYKYVGFSRVPGNAEMTQWSGFSPPTPGTFAAKLINSGSIDFIWKGLGGAEVIAHFMPGGYGYGDGLYSGGYYQLPTNNTFNQYIKTLKPVSPTGYMFLPVGSDFMPPDVFLPQQVSGWDSTMYQSTGVWITMATFEDYMKLVSFHRDKIPVYAVDLNPYFTGYYGSRPEIKRLARQVTYMLTSAQLYSIIASTAGYTYPYQDFNSIWEYFIRSDHHDFIPGTSIDKVYYGEQLPLLENTLGSSSSLSQSATTYIAQNINTSSINGIPIIVFNPSGFIRSDIARVSLLFDKSGTTGVAIKDQNGAFVPSQIITSTTYTDGTLKEATVEFYADKLPSLGYAAYSAVTNAVSPGTGVSSSVDALGDIILSNPYEVLILGKNAGYAITSLVDKSTGRQMISGYANDIIYYHDTGDFWAIGSEPDSGGVFTREYALSQTSSTYSIIAGPLFTLFTRVKVETDSPYGHVTRTYTLYSKMKRIDLSTTLSAPTGTTVAAVFSTTVTNGIDKMAVPYGIAQRPFKSLYTPQFWPGVEWIDLLNSSDNTGVAIFDLGNEMWSFNASGEITLGLVRNPLLNYKSCELKGACGSDNDIHTLEYAIMPHAEGAFFTPDGYAFSAPLTATVTTNHDGSLPSSLSLASTNNSDVLITAVKESKNNNGIILRLFKLTTTTLQVSLNAAYGNISNAVITNSYETPKGKPVINGSTIGIDMTGTISTLFIPSK